MALTQSFNTSYSSSSNDKSRPSQPQLPPPQSFDILPPLHELLARIDHADSSLPPSTSHGESEAGTAYAELPPLEPRDLPTEVLPIKAKIRKAMKELEKLPDMDRTVEEQQDEILELEQRIEKQKEAIRLLGELASGVNRKLGIGS